MERDRQGDLREGVMAGAREKRPGTDRRRRMPSPATVVAFVALIAALAGNAFALQANSVRSKHIVDGQVKRVDLANGAATTQKLGRRGVKPAKLAPGAVGPDHIATGAVGSAAVADRSLGALEFAPLSIAGIDLATGAVSGPKLAATTITSAKVEDGSLGGGDLAPGTITASRLANNSVNSAKVVDDSLTGDDINEATLGSPLARNRDVYSNETANNSTSPKTIDVTCPVGRSLVGGGGRVFAAGVPAALIRSYPVTPSTWRAEAAEPEASAANWSLLAYAICAQL